LSYKQTIAIQRSQATLVPLPLRGRGSNPPTLVCSINTTY